ncbi:RNA polymerase sigma factor [Cognatiyoonia sp. IB215182]|uniref:RNA polymerase sigma factor n=1 Tax=Cognatiyoonia sp. IB215182 TaxID=3097353 RepID=UPI002A102AA1|nr:RNA polymerase sigma factor [Cognatiyoonia sp. IB215182]MDX8353267.1 RNA polymerase sigma factor [Cognatiyoonia sp. IB215182]
MAIASVMGTQDAARYREVRNQPIESRGKIADGGSNLTSVPVPQPCDTMTPDQFKTEMIGLLPRLRRFAVSLTRSGPDADDLLQEACTTALQKWQQYDPSQPFDRWMFRVVRNLWISEVRKRKVRQGEGQIDAEEAHELQTPGSAEETLTAQQVRKKVADLDEDLAQPLMLVCAEGYSYKEVSELLSIPIGTVMSRIHRARKLLVSRLSVEESLQQ